MQQVQFLLALQGPNSSGFTYVTVLEERKPDLDEKIIINNIVKLIYFFKNDLPDRYRPLSVNSQSEGQNNTTVKMHLKCLFLSG